MSKLPKLDYRPPRDEKLNLSPPPDAGKTVARLILVLIMLVIAVIGTVYSGWMLWHLPSKP